MNMNYSRETERYDILGDSWEDFSPMVDFSLVAPTAIKVKERYIFLIGGLNYMRNYYGHECMENKLLMLDVENPGPAWQRIPLQGSVFQAQIGQIGVIPLSQKHSTEFLVFGGIFITSENDRSYSTQVHKLDLT